MFKSKFEKIVAEKFELVDQYELDKLDFIQPEQKRKYIPDFKLTENAYLEVKGKFTTEDRKKMLWVKEQYPHIRFYLLFQNPRLKIRKGSPTSVADWCDKNGFEWTDIHKGIPQHWYK